MAEIIEYLNTDLELVAADDLRSLTRVLESHGFLELPHAWHDHDGWHVAFESAEQFDEPESTITAMLSSIESLDPEAQAWWATCTRREFDIGYRCGGEPLSLKHQLSPDILRRIVTLGACLRITLYSPQIPRFEPPA